MTSPFVILLAQGKQPTDAELANELFEICQTEHHDCNHRCPVYDLNGGHTVAPPGAVELSEDCTCFKNGRAMLSFIRSHA